MKQCPYCGSLLEDEAAVCTNCGNSLTGEQHTYYTHNIYSDASVYDHTSEFRPADIAENKVPCMVIYLMGALGMIIALLAGRDSAYVAFHVRQELKMTVIEILLFMIGAVFVWTFIVPIAAIICIIILFVLRLIAFFQVCAGKAVEPSIIRDINFLR